MRPFKNGKFIIQRVWLMSFPYVAKYFLYFILHPTHKLCYVKFWSAMNFFFEVLSEPTVKESDYMIVW